MFKDYLLNNRKNLPKITFSKQYNHRSSCCICTELILKTPKTYSIIVSALRYKTHKRHTEVKTHKLLSASSHHITRITLQNTFNTESLCLIFLRRSTLITSNTQQINVYDAPWKQNLHQILHLHMQKNYNKDIGNYNVSLMSLVHTTVSYLQFMTTRMVEYICMYVQIKTRLTEAT